MLARAIARAVLWLAALKVAAGLLGALLAPSLVRTLPGAPIPQGVHLVTTLVFGAAAGWLIFGGRRDRRAVHLGGIFLLTAAAFAERLIESALTTAPAALVAVPLAGLGAAKVEALLPFLFWLFAREFPRAASFSGSTRLAAAMGWVSLAFGLALFALNLVAGLAPAAVEGSRSLPSALLRSAYGGFWPLVFALVLPAFGLIVWKARRAAPPERRRVALFVGGLVLGMGPLFLEVLLEALVPPFGRFMRRPGSLLVGGLLLYPLLLSIPFTTAYSVLVYRVVSVKHLVRRALEYLLARWAVMALVAIPFLALAVYLYARREEPIGRLLVGGGGLALMLAVALGLLGWRQRRRLLETLDRRFFREQYDARRILADLVHRSRLAESPAELAALLEGEIDRALHLDSIAVLTLDEPSQRYVSASGRCRSLAADALLAKLATARAEPLEADLEAPGSPLARLPPAERQWLADAGLRLLVPLLVSDASPLGLMALGEKRSELPFTAEDRSLLTDIAASGSLALENLVAQSRPDALATAASEDRTATWADPGMEERAAVCAGCRLVYPGATESCPACGRRLEPARVPYVLLGKFRVQRRLGAGGMGVVYQAIDLVLGRQVAMKTLPRLSPERSLRMRREARAMAAVSHPGLALIFGAETWRGTPILILEYLEGGTLADRLRGAPMPVGQALDLGRALTEGVAALHAGGILHRDVKPSNIGFTAQGTAKLLDFGLARILEEAAAGGFGDESAGVAGEGETEILSRSVRTEEGRLLGTPLYMSPEATTGQPPDPTFDLWALTLVLYEAIAGSNPFKAATVGGTRRRILERRPPRLTELRSDCPPAVADFFAAALAPDLSRRPSTARELARQLGELRGTLAAAA